MGGWTGGYKDIQRQRQEVPGVCPSAFSPWHSDDLSARLLPCPSRHVTGTPVRHSP